MQTLHQKAATVNSNKLFYLNKKYLSAAAQPLPRHTHQVNGAALLSPKTREIVNNCRIVNCRASQNGPAQDMSAALSLDNIRSSLIRQEDTIIFAFIERAQFARNEAVYKPDAIPVPGYNRNGQRYSLLQYVVRETEQLHGKLRRYTSPDEHPFFPDEIPPMVLAPIIYPRVLAPCSDSININEELMACYINHVVPGITQPLDDNNYGSTAVLDVMCLQALSKRIHYGKFVAEAKFRAAPAEYSRLIRARDADAIMALLTDKAVEAKVVERVQLKCRTFGQDITAPGTPMPPAPGGNGGSARCKVPPEVVARVYEEWVMPLTKEVEVQYLLHRLDHEEPVAQPLAAHAAGAAQHHPASLGSKSWQGNTSSL